jgi:hypothetical protein
VPCVAVVVVALARVVLMSMRIVVVAQLVEPVSYRVSTWFDANSPPRTDVVPCDNTTVDPQWAW